ncbi:hypothetical protein ABH935_005747 [Catenulispora sp. GAS73]
MAHERFDSTSDLVAAAATWRTAGYPDELAMWLSSPNAQGRHIFR